MLFKKIQNKKKIQNAQWFNPTPLLSGSEGLNTLRAVGQKDYKKKIKKDKGKTTALDAQDHGMVTSTKSTRDPGMFPVPCRCPSP